MLTNVVLSSLCIHTVLLNGASNRLTDTEKESQTLRQTEALVKNIIPFSTIL